MVGLEGQDANSGEQMFSPTLKQIRECAKQVLSTYEVEERASGEVPRSIRFFHSLSPRITHLKKDLEEKHQVMICGYWDLRNRNFLRLEVGMFF